MIDRKAALLACAEGHWVRTAGMRGLRLNAQIDPDVILEVSQLQLSSHGLLESAQLIKEPGVHKLNDAVWTKVCVLSGPFAKVLCLLESGAEDPVPCHT